jgi:hypothetical protein
MDLATHEGRLAAIREMRETLSAEACSEALASIRAMDPYPVMQFTPGKGVEFSTRQQLLQALGPETNSPQLCSLLKQVVHPTGTVFQVMFCGKQHSFLRTVMGVRGPQDN